MEADLNRLMGEVHLQRSPPDEAEAAKYLARAIEIARRQESRLLQLRATTSLARLWQRQGRGDEARQMLAEIYEWFTEGFDKPDLKEATALLDSLAIE